MKRALRLVIGFGLGGLFLWLSLRHVDLGALVAAAGSVDGAGLLLAPLCLSIGYGCRVLRWRMMLAPHNPALGYGRPAAALLAATAVNNLVPLRAGDALRCFGFSNWLGVVPGAVMGTMLVERLLDLIALLLAFGAAVWLLAPTGSGWGAFGVLALGFAVIGAGVLALVTRPVLLEALLSWAFGLGRRLGPKAQVAIEGFVIPLRTALSGLSARQTQAALVAWTIPVWFFEGATFWAVALFMPALTAPVAAWLAMPAGTLATLLPTTPGHVGPFDYAAQMASLALENPLIEATAFVLIVHAVLWVTTTVAGLVCLAIWALADTKKAAA
jgi:uncharacterized protein (TIRG00374 family)